MAKKTVVFKFRDGEKEISIGDEVAFTNRNYQRSLKIFTDKVSKIGNKLIHLEGGRSFYISDGIERVDICGSDIYSSEERVHYMRKISAMKSKISDAFSWAYNRRTAKLNPEKIEQCYKIIFGDEEIEDGIY